MHAMMSLRTVSAFMFSAVCMLHAPAALAEQQEHPFFRTAQYPAWSQMTPEQALADARAAIEESRAQLEKRPLLRIRFRRGRRRGRI